jgi:hypothetical protein
MEKQLKIPDEMRDQAEQTALMAQTFQINDKNTLETGAGVLMSIFKVKSAVEAKRVAITKPLNEALRVANGMFRPYLVKLDEAEKILKGKITDYKLLEDKRLSEERQKNLASVDPFDTSAETMALVEDTQLKIDGLSFRNEKEVVIIDESLIPNKYWVLDMKKLNDDVKHGEKVAGVELRIVKKAVKGR